MFFGNHSTGWQSNLEIKGWFTEVKLYFMNLTNVYIFIGLLQMIISQTT